MHGVVLCGGKSLRMGRDKGLLLLEDTRWAELAFAKLAALGLPVVLSINQQQELIYSACFSKASLIVDNFIGDLGGPLKGILSVHHQFPKEDLFILACDMIDMQIGVLQECLHAFTVGDAEFVMFDVLHRLQPLCGIYSARGLSNMEALYENKKLKQYSMMHVLSVLNVQCLIPASTYTACFNNYNYPL